MYTASGNTPVHNCITCQCVYQEPAQDEPLVLDILSRCGAGGRGGGRLCMPQRTCSAVAVLRSGRQLATDSCFPSFPRSRLRNYRHISKHWMLDANLASSYVGGSQEAQADYGAALKGLAKKNARLFTLVAVMGSAGAAPRLFAVRCAVQQQDQMQEEKKIVELPLVLT